MSRPRASEGSPSPALRAYWARSGDRLRLRVAADEIGDAAALAALVDEGIEDHVDDPLLPSERKAPPPSPARIASWGRAHRELRRRWRAAGNLPTYLS